MGSGTSIDRAAIERYMHQIQREFDRHAVTVSVRTIPTPQAEGATVNIYSGPVIHGDANNAQLVWGNATVTTSSAAQSQQIASGYEDLARTVAETLEFLVENQPLGMDDHEIGKDAGEQALRAMTEASPDSGLLRRSLATLRGALMPLMVGAQAGVSESATEWAKHAVEQLSHQL